MEQMVTFKLLSRKLVFFYLQLNLIETAAGYIPQVTDSKYIYLMVFNAVCVGGCCV